VDVILAGLGNYGSGIARHLLDRGKTVIGVDFEPEALEKWRSRGMIVLYGDMGDPEIHEQLPIDKARWIVSTVRSKDLNLALLHLLRNRGYGGRIALAAANETEAGLFREAGADVVLRPFIDAAEQAADALTYATDVLPAGIDWPVTFQEIRLESASVFAGKTLKAIPLRSATHVSVLAVSRAGRVYSDPGPVISRSSLGID
jgi:Trk K+ transport system NAD-binding subunit